MIALGERQHSPFNPTWRAAFQRSMDFYNLFDSNYKNIQFLEHINRIKEKKSPGEKTVELIKWLANHHQLSARHCFGVANIARELGRNYFSYYNKDLGVDPTDILDKIFMGGLLHDIGKLGVEQYLLDLEDPLTSNQKEKMRRHNLIGARILEELGLYEFILFAKEHHVGQNGGISKWTKGQLHARHPLVEIISMADLIDASLDEARKYKRTLSMSQLIKIIHKDTRKGVFSKELEKAFLQLVKKEHPNQLLFSKYAPFSDLLETIPIN